MQHERDEHPISKNIGILDQERLVYPTLYEIGLGLRTIYG
jgi:hypothetical protein